MFPHVFSELMVRDTDLVVPYTLDLHVEADYFLPHRHHYIEFSYVIKGLGSEAVNGITHSLEPGTFSLLLPYQVHTLQSNPSNPVTFFVGGISLEKAFGSDEPGGGLERMLLQAPETLPSHVRFAGDTAARMERIFMEMLSFHEKADNWSHFLFLARLMEALVLFDQERRRQVASLQSETASEPPLRHDFRKIVHYVQTHSGEALTLQLLATHFHLSVPSISSGFRRLMGENYLSYLHRIRIQNACSLLCASPGLSVMEIALEVGYDSYETFARVFRKTKGISASRFRKAINVSVMQPSKVDTMAVM